MNETPNADYAPPKHQHDWVFVRTDEDWWGGDEVDVYHCTVEGCLVRDHRYVPR